MQKRYICSLFVVCLMGWMGLVSAQSNAFTLETAMLGGAKVNPGNLSQLGWIPGTGDYVYASEKDGSWALMSGSAAKGGTKSVLALADLNAVLKGAGVSEFPRFPQLKFMGATVIRFEADGALHTYDWATKKLVKGVSWSGAAANADINDQGSVAYTIDNNLYVSMAGMENYAVTKEVNKGIRHGEAAHRFEFGISKGTFWSPDGKQLAFYRMDETMVTDYPILNLRVFPATDEPVKYPFAGAKSHHVTVGVFNAVTKNVLYLETGGDPEHYLTNVTWSADGKEIWIAELNRDQNRMNLVRYDAATGKRIANVIEESDEKYVEPKHGPIFIPGVAGEFLWLSQKDGYNHLYHYKLDGILIGQLTSGPWIITEFLGFDATGKFAYIETTQQNATERHVYALDIKKRTLSLLTPGKGVHTASVHEGGKYLLDTWTAIDVPRTIRVLDMGGKPVQELLKAEDPLKGYNLPQAKLSKIKAADGKTDLWARTFLPANFDANKKYPVLIYVYNGPGVQLNLDTYLGAGAHWMPWLAQQGYIVFSLDGRGSANRGKDFEQAIFRRLGDVEVDDQMAGVEYLRSLPYVDQARIAVHGWSYGGFMTCMMLMRNPGVFKVGVAGGPVIDWAMYEVMYTERYMDTPQQNPEGYQNANLLNLVADLEAKLLLIHGTSDDVVVWQQSLEMVEASITKGVQLDYFVYPNHPHNVRGKDRLHLMTKVLNYVVEGNR